MALAVAFVFFTLASETPESQATPVCPGIGEMVTWGARSDNYIACERVSPANWVGICRGDGLGNSTWGQCVVEPETRCEGSLWFVSCDDIQATYVPTYVLGSMGAHECPAGAVEITDRDECESALASLSLHFFGFGAQDGQPCYKSGSYGFSNGNHGSDAEFLCRKTDGTWSQTNSTTAATTTETQTFTETTRAQTSTETQTSTVTETFTETTRAQAFTDTTPTQMLEESTRTQTSQAAAAAMATTSVGSTMVASAMAAAAESVTSTTVTVSLSGARVAIGAWLCTVALQFSI